MRPLAFLSGRSVHIYVIVFVCTIGAAIYLNFANQIMLSDSILNHNKCVPPFIATLTQGRSGSSMLNKILDKELHFRLFPFLSEIFGGNAKDEESCCEYPLNRNMESAKRKGKFEKLYKDIFKTNDLKFRDPLHFVRSLLLNPEVGLAPSLMQLKSFVAGHNVRKGKRL